LSKSKPNWYISLIKDILKEKIPSKDSPSAKNDEKVEAKAKFDALLSQKRDLIAKKKTVQEELKTLQAALKKNVPLYITQTENIKNAKSKIGFKSVSDVDQQIAYKFSKLVLWKSNCKQGASNSMTRKESLKKLQIWQRQKSSLNLCQLPLLIRRKKSWIVYEKF
jgi:hypothetical protein